MLTFYDSPYHSGELFGRVLKVFGTELGPYSAPRLGKAAHVAAVEMTFGSHRFLGSHSSDRSTRRQALPWNSMNERRKLGGGEGRPNGDLWVLVHEQSAL